MFNIFRKTTPTIKVPNTNVKRKKWQFWAWAALSATLALIFSILLAKGYLNYYHQSSLAEVNSRSVTYSIKQEKIISQPSQVKINPAPAKVESSALPATPTTPAASADASHNDKDEHKSDQAAPAASAPSDGGEEKKIIQGKPAIAIVITGVGLSASSTASVLKLPALVTVGFSPYAQDAQILAKKFMDLKHDVVMNIPLEPSNYPVDDPGPYALLTNLSDKDNLDRLDFLADRVSNVIGFYSMDNEKFTMDQKSISPIIEEMKKRNLIYVYGGGKDNTTVIQIADTQSFPLIVAKSIIDKVITEKAINDNLDQLVDEAKKNGFAVALGSPYPVTANILSRWLETLDEKGVELVGLKEIVDIIQKKSSP
jgi:polysaccharide deacetylase 2 family uncharacterized protein YibQ